MAFTGVKGTALLFLTLFTICDMRSQNVAINASGAAANQSAILDLDGVSGFAGPNGYKGFLVPRMTNAQRTGIVTLPAAAQGMIVYQTDGVQGFYYNTSVTTTPSWAYLSPSGTGWSVLGNTGTTQPATPATYGTSTFGAAENWMGTTDAKDVVFGTGNIERMRLFSSGQLSIGTSLVGAKLDVNQVTGTAVARFTTFGNTNDIELRRAQGTQAAPTATSGASTVLGRIFAQGYNGASYTSAASISLETDAAGGTSTDMPGRIVFNTTLDGTGTPLVERMRITNAGLVGIGTIPITTLDVNGAFSERFSTAAAAATITIPANVSLFRVSATVGVQANAATATGPQDGQYLVIINEDDNACTFAGFTIPAVAAGVAGVGSFVYSGTGAVWRQISSAPSAGGGSGWGLTGNAGTDGGATNFIGTTDNKALSFRANNQKSGIIDPAGPAFFGYQAGKVNTGVRNTGIGYQALTVNTSGSFNTAAGYQSMVVNTDGAHNTALGAWTMFTNVHGADNTAVGVNAMYNIAGDGNTLTGGFGNGNTAVGYQSLYFNSNGQFNTALGFQAYMQNTFSNCMVLGADPFNFCNPTANNQVWVGDNNVTSIKGQVAFGTYSDARIKNNVEENVPGLAFIKELRPVTYFYDYEKELQLSGGKANPAHKGKYDIEKIRFSGFLAQEVEAAANKVGYDFSGVDKPQNGKGLYSLRYSEFVVPLVKAVQELSSENEALKLKMEQVSADNKEIRAELDRIKMLLEANK
jgi:hypothetical protein